MPRSIRIEYPGAFYHVMARGNRRERIFRDDDDRRFFLKNIAQACEMTGWRVHAWVLMGNHYHLLIQTPEANLVAGMKWLQNTYTLRFNIRHRLWGRLFGDRYKSVLVEGAGYYYETLLDYIHLNPERARLVNPQAGESVLDYPWCSVAGGCALPQARRHRWLAVAEALQAFGCADTAAGRRKWVERLDRRASREARESCAVPEPPPEPDGRASHCRRGWYWGSQVAAGRGPRSRGSQSTARQRRKKSGYSAGDPAEHNGKHELAGRASCNAQRGKREPANPAQARSKKTCQNPSKHGSTCHEMSPDPQFPQFPDL